MAGSLSSSILVVVMLVTPLLAAASINGNFTDISAQHPMIYPGVRSQLTNSSRPSVIGDKEMKIHMDKECPDIFSRYGDYCFYYFNPYTITGFGGVNHSFAESWCADLGATLPYPTGDAGSWIAAVQDAVSVDTWPSCSGAILQYDVGWVWPDGSAVPLDVWWNGEEPSRGDQKCSKNGFSGMLHGTTCDFEWALLCQANIGATTTPTDAPTTAPGGTDYCYQCFKCNTVDDDTDVVVRGQYHSCFTTVHVFSGEDTYVIRGVDSELWLDGECKSSDDGAAYTCYCNSDLCNDDHTKYSL